MRRKKPIGRMLTSAELRFCAERKFELGFDVDTVEVQLHHICHSYVTKRGALCKTKDLWGQGGFLVKKDQITCLRCLELLKNRMRKEKVV